MYKSKIKNLFSVISGHIIEHYNFTLFGFYAVILETVFFSGKNNALSVFAVIAIGNFFKPLGGLIFGYIGDKMGRKKSLLYSIIWCSIPTLILGLTPSYETIGTLAPIILIFCISIQGICFAGELTGSAIFITENSEEKKLGLMGGILLSTGFFGSLLATTCGIIFTKSSYPEYSWRFSFILGGLLGLSLYFLRKNIKETDKFLENVNLNKIVKIPLLNVIKNYPKNAIATFILGGCLPINLYMNTYFFNYLLIDKFKFLPSEVMIINSITIVIWILLLTPMGLIADRIGKKTTMIISSSTCIIFSYPLFYYIGNSRASYQEIIFFQLCMSIIGTTYAASLLTYLSGLFPSNIRHTGLSFCFNFGQSVLGTTTPFIATYLSTKIGFILGPSLYLVFSGVACLYTLLFIVKEKEHI